jgi:hypothetical protein
VAADATPGTTPARHSRRSGGLGITTPHLRIQEHAVRRSDAVARFFRRGARPERGAVQLLQRAEAARWAIAELGIDPKLALSYAVWPSAESNAGLPSRYDD